MRRRTERGLPVAPPARRRRGAPAAVCAALTTALTATLCAVGPYAAAAPADASYPYAFGDDDQGVRGATSTGDAVRLDPGRTYRSTLPDDATLSYRLDLDATTNAYVSATAVPRPGARVSAADGLRVSVQDADGHVCSTNTVHFGPTRSAHPVAAWAARLTGEGGAYLCRGAGAYYAVVERRGASGTAGASSSPDDWDLELDYVSEPAPRGAGDTAPESWNSASPEPVLGDPVRRAGGAGFAKARALGQGVWKDGVRPGQTLFYKVPVDWGQQLYATAELGSRTDGGGSGGFVGTALTMSLYNPVRGRADDAEAGYGGEQITAALRPLPPVAYENRYASVDRVGAMRFAGWYYLAVHLGTPVADRFGDGPFGLTLRIRVSGSARPGPAYVGRSAPAGVFEVTGGAREATAAGAGGGSGSGGGGNGTMRLVAAGGLGMGSLLVLWLALWTLLSRRRRPYGAG